MCFQENKIKPFLMFKPRGFLVDVITKPFGCNNHLSPLMAIENLLFKYNYLAATLNYTTGAQSSNLIGQIKRHN